MSRRRRAQLGKLAGPYELLALGYSGESSSELESALVAILADLLKVPASWLLFPAQDGLTLGPVHGIASSLVKERIDRKELGSKTFEQLTRECSGQTVRQVGLLVQEEWATRKHISRILLLPLIFKGDALGIVCVPLARGRKAPDAEFCRVFQTNAASVLGRAKSIETIEKEAAANQRSARSANELVQFAGAIDLNDVELIWDRAIEYLPRMFSAGLVSIFLYDKTENKLVLKRGYNQDFEGAVEVDLDSREGGGLMATAVRSGAPWLSHDVRGHKARRNGPKYRSDSCLIIPLKESSKEHKLIGVVNFANPTDDSGFRATDLDSAAIVGELLGTKISNALMWAELQKLAVTDSLTGLFVHGFFKESLERELTRAERFSKPLSLLMIDVDLFKQINDLYGHPAGDTALVAIANVLTDSVRDSVDVVARYGGEEFAIILLETKKQSAKEVADRVRQQVAKQPLLHYIEGESKRIIVPKDAEGAKPFHATISIGLASFPVDAKSPERLIDLADAALYEGKSAGGNKVVLAGSGAAP